MIKKLTVVLCVVLLSGLLTCAVSFAEGFDGREDIQYVVIYNPNIWQMEDQGAIGTLYTGNFASQIDTKASVRAGETFIPEIIPYDQPDITELLEEIELSTDTVRAGGLRPIYEKGDRHEFYIGRNERHLETLKCLYAGEYCYVWATENGVDEKQAEQYGIIFDQEIYAEDIATFGTARFTDGGGKIHILYYDFDSESLGGFFRPYDLFSAREMGADQAEREMNNVDHAIINVNASLCKNPEYKEIIISTMAHEFQHLICFTDYFISWYNSMGTVSGFPDVWLNEAMSGYIEEKLYPGIQEKNGRYISLAQSYLIREGQSLYNFGNETRLQEKFDIGVYGSVFLFAEYLEKNAGPEIFHRIHDYYRSGTNMNLTTAAALYHTLPETFIRQIDEQYIYPDDIQFVSVEEEWLSKLSLDFYLSMLSYDENDPAAFEKIRVNALLYDNLNPATIEGGGRIIIATKNGSFDIPADADPGLVYVGLNKYFEPVTGVCSK